jgi:hypothetical protein
MLVYTGGGYGGARPNIPARDLTDEEIKRYGGEDALLKTGLYERAEKAMPKHESPIEKRKEGE